MAHRLTRSREVHLKCAFSSEDNPPRVKGRVVGKSRFSEEQIIAVLQESEGFSHHRRVNAKKKYVARAGIRGSYFSKMTLCDIHC